MDSLRGTDVVKDLFELISRQYDDGWIPKDSKEPRAKYLEHVRKELYRQQIKAKPKKRLNKVEILEQVNKGSPKCVFAIFATVSSMQIYMHAYFNAAAANMESQDILIDDDGWIFHPEYPYLKMGVYQ